METRELVERIEQNFHAAVIGASSEGSFAYVNAQPARLKEILSYCLHDQSMRFDLLDCLFGIDTGDELVVVYQLFSTGLGHRLNIKTSVSRHNAKLPSVTGFWRAATVYELEAAEMFGILFEGHPSPRHLLLPDDWQGHPLRKDYVFPEEYQQIEHRRTPLRKEHARP